MLFLEREWLNSLTISTSISLAFIQCLVALAFLTFAVTYFVGGNGLLSVYIAALILNNDGFLHKKGSNAVLRWTSLVNADSDVFNPGTTGFPLPDYSNHRYRVCNLLLPYTGCQAPGCIPVSFTL